MIELKNIQVSFNENSANELQALKHVSVTINQGEFAIIIGSNGSGKSTLLNVIAGTIFPQNGTVSINNIDVTRKKEFERAKFISRIFQNPLAGTASELTIIENFRLASLRTKNKGLTIGTSKEFEKKVKEKISFLKMGLENYIYKPMGTLSGGQRQALTLVMGIMDECKIMLLDEPVAALDPRSANLVMEKANDIISENKLTALMVTHQLKDALKYGNRLLMMKEGVINQDITTEKRSLTLNEISEWFE